MEDLWPHCDTCHYISFNGFPIFNGLLYFTSRYDGFHHCCWFCLMQCLALYSMLAWNSLVASADPELMAVLVPHPLERFLACHLHLPNVKQYRLVYIPLKHLPREFSHCCRCLPWKRRSYMCVKLYIKSLVSGSKRAVYFGSSAEWLGNPQALPRSNDRDSWRSRMLGGTYSNTSGNHIFSRFLQSNHSRGRDFRIHICN